MKKLLLMSDIHGYQERFERIVKEHPDVDYRLSAGDSELEASLLTQHDVMAVYGNAFMDAGEAQIVLTVEKMKLVMVHGHEHRVHHGDHGLVKLLKKHQAHFVIHGHTHVARHTPTDVGIIVNPGAISRSRGALPASYALLTLEQSLYTITWYDALTHEVLGKVKHSLKEQ